MQSLKNGRCMTGNGLMKLMLPAMIVVQKMPAPKSSPNASSALPCRMPASDEKISTNTINDILELGNISVNVLIIKPSYLVLHCQELKVLLQLHCETFSFSLP